MRVAGIVVLTALLVFVPAARGQVVAPEFSGSYALDDLGRPAGVPTPFGGLTLKAGTTDRLLIGGSANTKDGALYEIGVVRDALGHITRFEGEATRSADAEFNDGGVVYGPGDVLFLARWPENKLGQIKPGSTATKVVDMEPLGVASSLAAFQFVPPGQPGAGSMKLASYGGGEWYDAAIEPDGEGTFDLTGVTQVKEATLPGGPEGFVYVPPGSPQFDRPSLVVSEYDAGNVAAYEVDDNGDPVIASRRTFISELSGAEGAFIDPLTGDYLFSTFGGSDQVVVVRGFAPPTSIAVQTSVTNDNGGIEGPGDFTVHVKLDGKDVAGSPQQGAQDGAFYAVEAGNAYTVTVDPVPGYATSIGGDCAADGKVVPEVGVQPVCTITANDQPTATLHVVKHVDGGAWQAGDFMLGVRRLGVDVGGSPRPGDEEGSVYQLVAGTYTVSEEAARGYEASFSEPCAGGTITLADDDDVTCVVTNHAVPLGPGYVVESYGPARTDGDWGFTESLLSGTRGYLTDPANFGPGGIVAGPLQIAPGIRVASTSVLKGVDVFFTGWVPTGSYTAAERQALHDFVLAGGTLIATTDDTGHTMVDLFGLTQSEIQAFGEPVQSTITDTGHPIANGPFGVVTSYFQYMTVGHYPELGNDAHSIGHNADGTSLAVIERGKLGPNSGAVILVADVDVFSDFGGSTANEALIKNIFAFAIGEGAQPTLTVDDVSHAEGGVGGTSFTFMARLSKSSSDPVRVHYATADDTATAPSDYAAASGDLEFAPGETVKTISITVNGDAEVETDERYRVNLSNASGAMIADSQGVGTITNDDVATVLQTQQQPEQQQQQPQQEELPPPEPGKTVNAEPKSGTVTIKLKGTNKFVELKEGDQVPVGSVIDTTKGRVTLVAASDKSGGTATADFYDGIFKVGQTGGSKPITVLKLVEKLSCPKGGKASAATRRKKKRRLWGDGSGSFRTEGSYSSATVRGTKWLVEDQCTSTLTKVARGKVAVRDFVKRKTVIVKAGKQYVARARR